MKSTNEHQSQTSGTNFAQTFEDLRIWSNARHLVNQVYDHLERNRDYGFRDQIQRASISVMNNIAEGFEREGKKDFARFLDIAKGSSGEVRSMLYIAEDRKYVPADDCRTLRDEYFNLSKSISSFAKSLRKQTGQ